MLPSKYYLNNDQNPIYLYTKTRQWDLLEKEVLIYKKLCDEKERVHKEHMMYYSFKSMIFCHYFGECVEIFDIGFRTNVLTKYDIGTFVQNIQNYLDMLVEELTPEREENILATVDLIIKYISKEDLCEWRENKSGLPIKRTLPQALLHIKQPEKLRYLIQKIVWKFLMVGTEFLKHDCEKILAGVLDDWEDDGCIYENEIYETVILTPIEYCISQGYTWLLKKILGKWPKMLINSNIVNFGEHLYSYKSVLDNCIKQRDSCIGDIKKLTISGKDNSRRKRLIQWLGDYKRDCIINQYNYENLYRLLHDCQNSYIIKLVIESKY